MMAERGPAIINSNNVGGNYQERVYEREELMPAAPRLMGVGHGTTTRYPTKANILHYFQKSIQNYIAEKNIVY